MVWDGFLSLPALVVSVPSGLVPGPFGKLGFDVADDPLGFTLSGEVTGVSPGLMVELGAVVSEGFEGAGTAWVCGDAG